mmetsp:Transcript_45595/g.110996  ORF Transcript_45595/g.110996 Transcript_45595/m.110996 type:complete len:197 (+) Transcript_45595:16-606(+)
MTVTTESLVEQCLRKARIDLQEKVESLLLLSNETKSGKTGGETAAAKMTMTPSSSAVAGAQPTPAVGCEQVDDEDEDEDNGYDPDDLAAAFFAKQAQKQQRLNQLPIKDWAVCVVNYSQKTKKQSKEKEDHQESSKNTDSDGDADARSNAIIAMDTKSTNTASQLPEEEVENLANQLFVDFKKTVSSSCCKPCGCL